jgi:hypothetical protein
VKNEMAVIIDEVSQNIRVEDRSDIALNNKKEENAIDTIMCNTKSRASLLIM